MAMFNSKLFVYQKLSMTHLEMTKDGEVICGHFFWWRPLILGVPKIFRERAELPGDVAEKWTRELTVPWRSTTDWWFKTWLFAWYSWKSLRIMYLKRMVYIILFHYINWLVVSNMAFMTSISYDYGLSSKPHWRTWLIFFKMVKTI